MSSDFSDELCGETFTSQFKLEQHKHPKNECGPVTYYSMPQFNTNTFANSAGVTVTLPAASGTIATTDGAETLTNKTLTGVTFSDPATASKHASISLSSATASTTTQMRFVQTTNRVITFPNVTGTLVTADNVTNLSGKTIIVDDSPFADAADNTKTIMFDLSGTTGNTNLLLTMVQDGDTTLIFPDVGDGITDTFAVLEATQTLTNKRYSGRFVFQQPPATYTTAGPATIDISGYGTSACIVADPTGGAITINNVANTGLTIGDVLIIQRVSAGGNAVTIKNNNTTGGRAFITKTGADLAPTTNVTYMFIYNGTQFSQV